jgi:Ribonuclease R winged-helix domain
MGHNKDMHDPGVQPPHQQPADLDLEILEEILDLLRKDAYSAELLAQALSQEGEQVGVDAVRSHLNGLASDGLVRCSGSQHTTEASGDEPVAKEVYRWEITEEGRAVVEPHSGVARAPYERSAGSDDGGPDAELWVLIAIAVVTALAAAYTLLTATGILGGG